MQVLSLNRSAVASLMTPQGAVPSAIRKRAVDGPVAVHELGLDGDAQADQRVHGGPAKAVYAYPSEHYPFWQTVRAQAGRAGWDEALPWGAMGENLSLQGLLETQVWAGDRLVFDEGGVELQVTEPRQPCFKFNAGMGFPQAAKLMAQSGYCGFYLAVVKTGVLRAGMSFRLVPGVRELSVPELFRLAIRG
jgi:MOSC domain-containing protein YiiM